MNYLDTLNARVQFWYFCSWFQAPMIFFLLVSKSWPLLVTVMKGYFNQFDINISNIPKFYKTQNCEYDWNFPEISNCDLVTPIVTINDLLLSSVLLAARVHSLAYCLCQLCCIKGLMQGLCQVLLSTVAVVLWWACTTGYLTAKCIFLNNA